MFSRIFSFKWNLNGRQLVYMHDICREVGSRIRFFRRANGYTLTTFAEAIHYSKSTVSKYERGEISIDIGTLSEIARTLGIPMSQLIEDRPSVAPRLFRQSGEDEEMERERYYLYFYSAHDGRPYLSRNAMFLGAKTALIYAEIPSDEEVFEYRTFYTGHVRRTEAFVRVYVVNPVNEDDIAVLEYRKPLKPAQAFTCFFGTLSIGPYFPLAVKGLVSKVPVTDEEWLKDKLILTTQEFRAFRAKNGFFAMDQAFVF